MPGGKVALVGEFGKAVPRANDLAVVAAINAIPHHRSEFFGDAATQFDSQVGNTPPCIHAKGGHDCLCGADIDTLAAVTAMFLCGFIHRQWQVRVDLAQEEPAAGFLINQVGVFANPAKAGFFR